MKDVLLISPPYMKLSYPEYKMPLALTKGCKYMNPGLLISSSVLSELNIPNKIIKVNDFSKQEIDKMYNEILDNTAMVGISCTCAWEYLESLKIAKLIKNYNKNIKIVLSGWQVKSIGKKVFEDSEFIDYIIIGDAEYSILELYQAIVENQDVKIPTVFSKDTKYENIRPPRVSFRELDFTKFPNYKEYIPYVEESRNCPFNCSFCLNSCVNDYYQCVPFEVFKSNVDHIEKVYGKNCEAILLAANFGVNYEETKKKLEYLKTKNISWNIELHIDNPWEYYIEDLKAAGINKVSIGFESGSPKVLKMMHKTQNPTKYLFRAKRLLRELNKQGIKPSLNLLIDYREDCETLSETLMFLNENRDFIKKVKGNFMFAFEGFVSNLENYDQINMISDNYSKKIHAFPVLPKDMTIEKISCIIDEIEAGNYSLDIIKEFKINN